MRLFAEQLHLMIVMVIGLPIIKTSSGKSTGAVQVAVLFQDQGINQLFYQLLNSRGVTTRIVTSLDQIEASERIVTEPQYLRSGAASIYERCLVVGNKDAIKDLPVLPLSRPLTEEKIEQALAKFLA